MCVRFQTQFRLLERSRLVPVEIKSSERKKCRKTKTKTVAGALDHKMWLWGLLPQAHCLRSGRFCTHCLQKIASQLRLLHPAHPTTAAKTTTAVPRPKPLWACPSAASASASRQTASSCPAGISRHAWAARKSCRFAQFAAQRLSQSKGQSMPES